MNIYGYDIDIENVKFVQPEPIIIRISGKQERNQKFPVYYYMNNLTGEYARNEEDICDIPHQGLDGHRYNYWERIDFQYDNVSKCIVVMLLKFSCYNLELGKPNLYQEINRFYITPKKEIIYKKKDEWIYIRQLSKQKDLPFDITLYPHISKEFKGYCDLIGNAIGNIFNKIVNLKGNKAVSLDYPENIIEFLMYKEPSVKTGPLQKKINEYSEIKLPEFIPNTINKNSYNIKTEGRLIKIKDNVLCLQMFNIARNEFYEGYRIYIEPDEKIINCKKNNYNEFVPVTNVLSGSHWKFSIFDYNSSVVEGTKLAYYKDIIKDIPVESRGYAIWCFINYPVFEKLYKAGFKYYLNYVFEQAYDLPLIEIATFFGVTIHTLLKEKNIYKSLGINKQQFEYYNHFLENNSSRIFEYPMIKNVKYALGNYNDISSIDIKTFETIFNFVADKMFLNEPRWYEMMNAVSVAYDNKTLLNSLDTIKMIAKKGYFSNKRLYEDYIHMVSNMGLTSTFKPKFNSFDELKNAHDNIVSLYNLKRDEYKAKGFNEALKRVEKYEYSNDTYTVIKPTSPNDLVEEGNKLHHCVRVYIDKVIQGKTNIMFLRKTQELDIPFFTIEISNDGKIEQIHGLQNCNISTQPTIEPFLKEWTKAKKIQLNNINKVR
jgi:hypothetical protein